MSTPSKPITVRINEAIFRARRLGWEPNRLKLARADLDELKHGVDLSRIAIGPADQLDSYLGLPLEECAVSGIDLVGRPEPEPI